MIDALTFTIATGLEETRRDAIETIEAIRELKRRYPEVQTTLGLSNVSFGLNPAGPAGAELGVPARVPRGRAGLGDRARLARSCRCPRSTPEQRQIALDLIYDRRDRGLRPAAEVPGSCSRASTSTSSKQSRAEELAALPLDERLQRRIVDGERNGLEADLDEAMTTRSPLAIINETLLSGMKTVGELFGSGEMQLPFVLQSAEVMKTAVAYLEPHMEKADAKARARSCWPPSRATSTTSARTWSTSSCPTTATRSSTSASSSRSPRSSTPPSEHDADAIGMSGLLVKSTVIMKENLAEMNSRGSAARWPVMLGGAALTRAYVENDLAELYAGDVRYARDAFEGLRLMDALMTGQARRATPEITEDEARKAAERKDRHERSARIAAARKAAADAEEPVVDDTTRSDVAARRARPDAAVLGQPGRQGHPARRLRRHARRARHVHGPVGPQGRPGRQGPVVRGAGGDRGPAAAAVLARPAASPTGCWRPPSSTATSRRCPRATT